jgi:FixJ family two-component response regulator
MSGPVLIERLSQMGLHVPVLFMSGYSEEALLRRDVFEHPVALLAKPFKRAALLSAVRTELARPSVVKA